jgi:hypothetical protein
MLLPFEKFIEFLETQFNISVTESKSILDAVFKDPQSISTTQLKDFTGKLRQVGGHAQLISKVFESMKGIAVSTNSVLSKTEEGWVRIGKTANAANMKTMSKIMRDVNRDIAEFEKLGFAEGGEQALNNLIKSMQAAKKAVDANLGKPIEDTFIKSGKAIGMVRKELQDIAMAKGNTKALVETQKTVEELGKATTEFEIKAGKLNLRQLTSTSKEAVEVIAKVRGSLDNSASSADELTANAFKFAEALAQAKAKFGNRLIGKALDNDKKDMQELYKALQALTTVSENATLQNRIAATQITEKGKFKDTTIELDGVTWSLRELAKASKKEGEEVGGTLNNLFSTDKIRQMQEQLAALGREFKAEDLGRVPAAEAAKMFSDLQKEIDKAIKKVPELSTLFRQVGSDSFIKLMGIKDSGGTIRGELNKIVADYQKFMAQLETGLDTKGQVIKQKLSEIFAKGAEGLTGEDLNFDNIVKNVVRGIDKLQEPLRTTDENFGKILLGFENLTKQAGFDRKTEEVRLFINALTGARRGIRDVLNAAEGSGGDDLTKIVEFSKYGVAEEGIVNLQVMTQALAELFSKGVGFEKFRDAWEKGEIQEQVIAITTALQTAEEQTTKTTSNMVKQLKLFSSSISQTLNKIKNEFSDLTKLQANTKLSEKDYGEFTKASADVDKFSTSIRNNAKKWEFLRSEIQATKSQKPKAFFQHMTEAIVGTEYDVGKLAQKMKDLDLNPNKQGDFQQIREIQEERLKLLRRQVPATKRALDRELELYRQQAEKINMLFEQTDAEKTKSLRTELQRLVETQNKYGQSIENLKAQLKTLLDIQTVSGQLLPEETARVQVLTDAINKLGIQYTSTAELQNNLNAASLVPDQMGQAYTAMKGRLGEYKKELTDVITKTSEYLGLSAQTTTVENIYQKEQEESKQKLEQRKAAIDALIKAEAQIGGRSSVVMKETDKSQPASKKTGIRPQKLTDEYKQLQKVVSDVNIELKKLGRNPIKLNTKDLGKVESELLRIRGILSKEMQGILDDFTKRFGTFEIEYKGKEQDAKRKQTLEETTKQLKRIRSSRKRSIW